MGLTGYCGRLAQNYGKLAKPWTDLTKKNAFQWNEIEVSWQQDAELAELIQKLSNGFGTKQHYSWQNSQSRRKGKLVIGDDPVRRNKIIQIWQSNPVRGQFGIFVTYNNIKRAFY
ncbi:hypothetical protein ACH5RR_029264 [Cinchona calisaya]|uniref:Uncharacterized protein n=1 Tax=Cinchona calisaya TaxID=153742 RepID=A0ABD2YR90_9GENT